MTSSESRLGYLYRRYAEKSCTPEELREFFACLLDQESLPIVRAMMDQHLEMSDVPADLLPIDWEYMYDKITHPGGQKESKQISRVVSIFKWNRVVAAVIFLAICTTGYMFFAHRTEQKTISRDVTGSKVQPGYNKAVLTLGNGEQIVLDSAHTGALTNQGNATLTNSNDGRLAYSIVQERPTVPLFNTLATPRGGQYQLQLSDGTRVWVNAASSIRYPPVFTGAERKVEVSGEAYFEVAKDKAHPFIVHTNRQNIQVLGTRFNINAYEDEETTTTTLLEGSVQIMPLAGSRVKTLAPGDQATLGAGGLVTKQVDAEDAVAWKEGYFRFDDEPLESILKRVARWYDVDFKFRDPDMRTATLSGMTNRFADVSDLLETLELSKQVKFKLTGRTIWVEKYDR
ncbi:MAG TPA: FecR domain-containing protein [Puia sp.]|jgi:transmembrane sensor|nr:FecR domain-containing protein [Puia sp.]